MMKICSKCNIEKSLEDFDNKSTSKDGKSSHCKDCRKQYVKEHYDRNKTYYKSKARKRLNQEALKIKEYKDSLSCIDCGLSFKDQTYLCEFHHIDSSTKDFNPAFLRNYGFKQFLEEIDKCIPLCCNCHRKRHYAPIAKLDTASEYESEDV